MDSLLGKNAIFIQARISSTRLPAKIFLDLQNHRSILQNCIIRAIEISKILNLEQPVILCPKDDIDFISRHIADFSQECRIFGGSESNVLQRFYEASNFYNVEGIIRATSDNPLLCFEPIEICLSHLTSVSMVDPVIIDLYSIKKLPNGTVVSGFNRNFLKCLLDSSPTSETKEHIVLFDINPAILSIQPEIPEVLADYKYRFCVDDLGDYKEILSLNSDIFDALNYVDLKNFLGKVNESNIGY